MPEVRDPSASTKKWARNAGQAGQSYTDGVTAPRRDWAKSTLASKTAYNSGVQEALSKNRWEKGINRTGTGKQQAKALAVGASRYPQGVAAAEGDYQARVTPYLDTIKSIQLPARGPKGAPQNIQRVAMIATALRAKKESM